MKVLQICTTTPQGYGKGSGLSDTTISALAGGATGWVETLELGWGLFKTTRRRCESRIRTAHNHPVEYKLAQNCRSTERLGWLAVARDAWPWVDPYFENPKAVRPWRSVHWLLEMPPFRHSCVAHPSLALSLIDIYYKCSNGRGC